MKPTDAVLVLGGGPIGLSVLQALKARHTQRIIVSEVAAKRKEFARDFGATHILDPTKVNLAKEVKALTGGHGVAVVFDAAGVQAAIDEAFECLRVRGTLVNIAIWVSAQYKILKTAPTHHSHFDRNGTSPSMRQKYY